MTSMTAMDMTEFVREVRARCDGAVDPAEMGRFLAASRIEAASLDGFVRFAPGRYTRHLVHKDRDVEILVLCWARGSTAPIHGHEGEYCWARVERGRLAFSSYREASRAPLRLEALGPAVEGGPGYVDGPADIHAVSNPISLGEDAVSIHVYCRPYDECDIYDTEQGAVRRVRLVYDSVPPHLAAARGGPAPRARAGVKGGSACAPPSCGTGSSWSPTSPLPSPGPARSLVRTLACGICGSDLHALKHAEQFVETARRAGNPFVMDLARDVVMGHEFCAEIVDHGPGTSAGAAGRHARLLAARAHARRPGRRRIGYSNDNPGGYGEYMRLTEALLLEVPNGLSTEHAALTEPMAVGVHAVEQGAPRARRRAAGDRLRARRSRRDRRAAPAGRAADRRRGLLAAAGASWPWRSAPTWSSIPPQTHALGELAGGGGLARPGPSARRCRPGCPGPRSVPPWSSSASACPACSTRSWRRRRAARASSWSACAWSADTIHPMLGIGKELSLQFVLGYTPDEFAATLRHIAGRRDPRGAAHHGHGRPRGRGPGLRGRSPRPSGTRRSSSSRAATDPQARPQRRRDSECRALGQRGELGPDDARMDLHRAREASRRSRSRLDWVRDAHSHQ